MVRVNQSFKNLLQQGSPLKATAATCPHTYPHGGDARRRAMRPSVQGVNRGPAAARHPRLRSVSWLARLPVDGAAAALANNLPQSGRSRDHEFTDGGGLFELHPVSSADPRFTRIEFCTGSSPHCWIRGIMENCQLPREPLLPWRFAKNVCRHAFSEQVEAGEGTDMSV